MFGQRVLSGALCLLVWFGESHASTPSPQPGPPRPPAAQLQPLHTELPAIKPAAAEKTGEAVNFNPDVDSRRTSLVILDGERVVALPKAKSIPAGKRDSWRAGHDEPPAKRAGDAHVSNEVAVVEKTASNLPQDAAVQTFAYLADIFDLRTLEQRSGLPVAQLFEKYQQECPLFSVWRSNPLAIHVDGGSGLLAAGSLGFVAYQIVDAFWKNTSSLEWVSITTSILPLAGCASQLAAELDQAHGENSLAMASATSAAMCFVGDVLMFTPAWPLGVAVQIGRFLFEAFIAEMKLWNKLKPDKLHQYRLDGWKNVTDQMETYFKNETFKSNLEVQLQSEVAAILFGASESKARLDNWAAKLREQGTAEDKMSIVNEAKTNAQQKLIQEACKRISERTYKLESDAFDSLAKLLRSEARRYDWQFNLDIHEQIKYSFRIKGKNIVHDEVNGYNLIQSPSAKSLSKTLDQVLQSVLWNTTAATCESKDFWGQGKTKNSMPKLSGI
ncbi:hypothetical protein QQS21_010309 [Conoideocrella luteorostrata]|uniref:Uncharacterized protein n=1 Tax=Conoideocrella luteorostrata TaxID=1105319 RepID=A0AAJ0CFF2_9HYPO|nr:hypothetical protein QQS21_010309 [Conoideocrella luteorostrata]